MRLYWETRFWWRRLSEYVETVLAFHALGVLTLLYAVLPQPSGRVPIECQQPRFL